MLTDILSKLLSDISSIVNFNITYSIGDKTIFIKIYDTTLTETLFFYWQDKHILWNHHVNTLLEKAKHDILKTNIADIQLTLLNNENCLNYANEGEETTVFSSMLITLVT